MSDTISEGDVSLITDSLGDKFGPDKSSDGVLPNSKSNASSSPDKGLELHSKSTSERNIQPEVNAREPVTKLVFKSEEIDRDLLYEMRNVEVKKLYVVPRLVMPSDFNSRPMITYPSEVFLEIVNYDMKIISVKHIAVTYKSLPGYQVLHNNKYWTIECTTELEAMEYSQFPEKLRIGMHFDYSLHPARRGFDLKFKELVLIPIDEFKEAKDCLDEYNDLTEKLALNCRRVLKSLKSLKQLNYLTSKELKELKSLDDNKLDMESMSVCRAEHKKVIERNDIKSVKLLRRSRDRIEVEQKKKRDLLVEKKRLAEELKSKESKRDVKLEMEKSRE